eukprot:CAMPEP_0116047040 /NCGR_PEP_ID=MMETSP0321-20121206/28635_1 /TAXON_ID=163516 /ORGANISM="Leptocylindrus danicus var. danicus, Strain B650" /LENGTH=207 /DNA_ID=CAMNT_0003528805 /DNA_START=86 /DNA_END=709 /DNA_ORIENTATION=+
MGIVWHGLAVESGDGSGARCALSVEHANESSSEWLKIISQQRSIERVGWKCLRLNAFSLLLDTDCTMKKVYDFLSLCDVIKEVSMEEEGEIEGGGIYDEQVNEDREESDNDMGGDNNHSVVLISSDEENISLPSEYRSTSAPSQQLFAKQEEETGNRDDLAFECMRRKRRRAVCGHGSESDSDRTVPLSAKRKREESLDQDSDIDSL